MHYLRHATRVRSKAVGHIKLKFYDRALPVYNVMGVTTKLQLFEAISYTRILWGRSPFVGKVSCV